MKRKISLIIVICFLFVSGFTRIHVDSASTKDDKGLLQCVSIVKKVRNNKKKLPLQEKYSGITVIDAHNHDATSYDSRIKYWNKYHIDKVAVSGYVSRKNSILTDQLTWEAYQKHPDQIYPIFGGIEPNNSNSLNYVQNLFEKGYMGIGEIAAPSYESPIVSTAEWKAESVLDGILPDVYKMAAKYKVPILFHIDPPFGEPIDKLQEAAKRFPNTTFIFGHANAFTNPEDMEIVIKKHSNIIFDMFAGYSDKNGTLKEFVPLIEKYPNQVVVSTDSAFDLEIDEAYLAIYKLLDMLKPETACKVANGNYQALMDAQKPTSTQLKLIKKYQSTIGKKQPIPATKQDANKLIFELENKLGLVRKPLHTKPLTKKEIDSAKTKPIAQLTNTDMVAIARDLITRLQKGLYSDESTISYKDLHPKLYFKGAILDKYIESRKNSNYSHQFHYYGLSFENEIVIKNKNNFIFDGDLIEDNLSLLTNERTKDKSRFKLWIAFDPISKSYKIKDEYAVSITK